MNKVRNNNRIKGEKHHSWKGGPLALKCKLCDTSFFAYKNEFGKARQFCSHTCYTKSMKGKSWSESQGRFSGQGKDHPRWIGQDVGYRGLHTWIERQLGKPNKCCECGKIGYGREIHWANKSRTYKRELTDWIRLCAKCHAIYDGNRGGKSANQLALT